MLKKLGNKEIRPFVLSIMATMPEKDRTDIKRIAAAVKASGIKPPSSNTLYKARDQFFNQIDIEKQMGLNQEDTISLHDLSQLLSQKDLINRIGIDKIKRIASNW